VEQVKIKRVEANSLPSPPPDLNSGVNFPYNDYLNQLGRYINDGWVLYLDDDDEFLTPNAIQVIVDNITTNNDMLLWQVKLIARIVPNDDYFGQEPKLFHITGIGFMFHSSHLYKVHWLSYKYADYHVIKNLYNELKPIWIKQVLIATQRTQGKGMGLREDKVIIEKLLNNINININMNINVVIIKDRYKDVSIGKIGDIVEMESTVAQALIQKGLVEAVSQQQGEEKVLQEKELEPVIENKELKPVIENKKLKISKKKKGRPKINK